MRHNRDRKSKLGRLVFMLRQMSDEELAEIFEIIITMWSR